jgi:hypothetical protein
MKSIKSNPTQKATAPPPARSDIVIPPGVVLLATFAAGVFLTWLVMR